MEYFEYIGAAAVITMAVSSVFIGLFRISFGNTSKMSSQERLTYKWWAPSVLNKELAQKAIPEKQFRQYWFFVQLQKYSVLCACLYMLISLSIYALQNT